MDQLPLWETSICLRQSARSVEAYSLTLPHLPDILQDNWNGNDAFRSCLRKIDQKHQPSESETNWWHTIRIGDILNRSLYILFFFWKGMSLKASFPFQHHDTDPIRSSLLAPTIWWSRLQHCPIWATATPPPMLSSNFFKLVIQTH